MRIKLFLIFSITYSILNAQDPSFSQIDLYSMYMNPALCGSSGHPKFLTVRREQWKGINGSGNQAAIGGNSPFTTSLAEISVGISGDNSKNGGIKAINFGISYLGEDNVFDENLEGSVFFKRQDYSGYLSFLVKLDNINYLKKYSWLQQKYLQFGAGFGGTSFGLNSENLIFSNMIDAYGGTYALVTNLPFNNIEKKIFPRFSAGIVLSMLGNTSSTKQNKTIIGYSFKTLNENFQLRSSITKKHTFHLEHKGSIPDWTLEMFPSWKVFYKSEHYKTDGWISKKYEIGQSIDIGKRSPIELGQLFRFTSNLESERKDLHWQTYIPFLRINWRRPNHGYQISYIYHEYERAYNKDNWIYRGNTGLTHEISLTVHLWGGKGAKECIEYGIMQENALFKDLKRNGLLSKKSARRNFR